MWFKVDSTVIDFRVDVDYVNLIDALEITVKSIMQAYSPPYRLMVTGGVDSQTMLLAWKWFGRDYIPTSVVYENNFNAHDLETLTRFSSEQKLDIQYVDFELIEFYNNNYWKLADKYKIVSPHFGAHIGMTENLDGTIILSGDRLMFGTAVLDTNNVCLYYASLKRPIVPYFLLHTPELAYSHMYAFSKIPKELRKVVLDSKNYTSKTEMLKHEGIPVIPQLAKYSGFERVKEYYDKFHSEIPVITRLKYASKPSKRAYDLLLRYPLEEKYGGLRFQHLTNDLHALLN
jgi:hypothetical protein